jgi:phosphate-selective porin OprO/OprP
MKKKLQMVQLLGAGMLVTTAAGMAGEAVPYEAAPEKESNGSFCDSLWKYAEWYKNPDNPVIQKFAFTGRFQADAAYFDASGKNDWDNTLWRRVRAGFKAQMFNDFTVHGEADWNLTRPEPLYGRLTDAYVAWSPSKAFKLKAGKHSAGFTLDGATSSKKLITMQRSNVANNMWFPVEYHTGLSASGKIDRWSYNAGAFSGKLDTEWGGFSNGWFLLTSLGYDFSDCVKFDKLAVRGDYVYNDYDLSDWGGGTRNLKHVASLSMQLEDGDWGLWTDLSFADGIESRGQSDLFGLQIMPFYNFTDKIQGVFRYTYVTSEDDNGVRFGRYEREVIKPEPGDERGDEYNEFYLGLNYYICGQRLKLQAGVQYADMNDDAKDGGDYEGWGLSGGLRLYW